MTTTPVTSRGVIGALDAALRDAVRREGVDPQRESDVVRRLAPQVVRDHDDRSLSGAGVPVEDPGAMVEELVAGVAAFGPLQALLTRTKMKPSGCLRLCPSRQSLRLST